MEKVLWKAIIQDLVDSGLSIDEIRQILLTQYPNRADIVSLVNDNIPQKLAKIRSFTKQAQDFGFGYQNPGPSNFNVPDPQGGSGANTQMDATPSSSTPSSSYTDKLKMRKEQNEKRKEEERKEKERAKMLGKLSATKPGDFIIGKTPETGPGEIIETINNVGNQVKTLDMASHSTSKVHDSPLTFEDLADKASPGQPKMPTPSAPKTTMGPTSTPTAPAKPSTSKAPDVSKSKQEVENLNKVTDKAQQSVDKLTDSISKLGQ